LFAPLLANCDWLLLANELADEEPPVEEERATLEELMDDVWWVLPPFPRAPHTLLGAKPLDGR